MESASKSVQLVLYSLSQPLCTRLATSVLQKNSKSQRVVYCLRSHLAHGWPSAFCNSICQRVLYSLSQPLCTRLATSVLQQYMRKSFIHPFAAALHTVGHQCSATVYAKGFFYCLSQPLCTRLATSLLQQYILKGC